MCRNRLTHNEELIVAGIIANTGKIVEFLPENDYLHTADIKFDNVEWEIKSPKGSSKYTLENNMRTALGQAENIIIYLGRVQIPEQKCLATIEKRAKLLGKKHKMMAITKNGVIHKFYN